MFSGCTNDYKLCFCYSHKYKFYLVVIVRYVDTLASLTLYIQRGGDMFVFTCITFIFC